MERNDFPGFIYYESGLSPRDCIAKIVEQPYVFRLDGCEEATFDATVVTESRLLITFTGGQYGRKPHTQYIVDFTEDGGKTAISFRFFKENFDFPPCTPLSHIDLFMQKKVCAVRTHWEPHPIDPAYAASVNKLSSFVIRWVIGFAVFMILFFAIIMWMN